MSTYTDLQEKLDSLDRKLEGDIKKRRRSNFITLLGGLFTLLFVAGYLTFFHSLAVDVAAPKTLLPLIAGEAEKQIPQVMAELQIELQRQAPVSAKMIRTEAERAIPEVRSYVEREFMRASEPHIKALERELDVLIRQGIEKDRATYEAFLKNPDDQKAQDALRKLTQDSLRSYFNDELIKADLKSYSDVMGRIDLRFKRLRDNKNLPYTLQVERELIVCLRELASPKRQ